MQIFFPHDNDVGTTDDYADHEEVASNIKLAFSIR